MVRLELVGGRRLLAHYGLSAAKHPPETNDYSRQYVAELPPRASHRLSLIAWISYLTNTIDTSL